MQKLLTIGSDFDMVGNDWEGKGSPFLEEWNRLLPGIPFLGAKESSHWEVSENHPEEYKELIRSIYVNPKPGFYEAMPPMEGFFDGIEKVRRKYRVVIVSVPILEMEHELHYFNNSYMERAETWARVCREKKFWLVKHFGKDAPAFYPMDQKDCFAGKYLIDDNPFLGIKCKSKPTWQHLLFDRGYKYNEGRKDITKGDWSTIPEYLSAVHRTIMC